jgi:hypothetical protein
LRDVIRNVINGYLHRFIADALSGDLRSSPCAGSRDPLTARS